MDASTIKFKTIQLINGVSYLAPKQVDDLKYIVTHNLNIDKTEQTDKAVEDGIKYYFDMQNSIRIAYISRMKYLGYEVAYNSCRPDDEDSFVPKIVGGKTAKKELAALPIFGIVRSYFKNCGGCGQITTSDRWIEKTERNIKDHYRPICKKCAIWAELPVY